MAKAQVSRNEAIAREYLAGEKARVIAMKYNITDSRVYQILRLENVEIEQGETREGDIVRATILDFIMGYWSKYYRAPTMRDIGAGCKISSNSVVNYHIQQLKADDLVVCDKRLARTIRLSSMRISFDDESTSLKE